MNTQIKNLLFLHNLKALLEQNNASIRGYNDSAESSSFCIFANGKLVIDYTSSLNSEDVERALQASKSNG